MGNFMFARRKSARIESKQERDAAPASPAARPNFMARLRRLARDTGASSTIEFAVIGPITLLLVLAVIENAMALFAQSILDNATRDAARLTLTGQAQNGGTSFATQLCNEISGYLKCSNISYRLQTSTKFGNLSPNIATGSPPTGFTAYPGSMTGGNAGDFVLIQVVYNRSFFIPWVGKLLAASGSDQIITTAAFENEPF